MSYKHNNLMAMRQNYWDDEQTPTVQSEKLYFQKLLVDKDIFPEATNQDAKYFFFSLPSIIIVKGYALGFQDQAVKNMILDYLDTNRMRLKQRENLKIQFNL